MNLPIILVDTREQKPYHFKSCATCSGSLVIKLDYGDYQLKDMQDLIVIERKQSIDELANNLGKDRARFERELERMQECQFKFIIIEDYWSSIWRRSYTKMNPNAIFESIIALELKYDTRFCFVGNRENGHRITRALLLRAYKYRKNGII